MTQIPALHSEAKAGAIHQTNTYTRWPNKHYTPAIYRAALHTAIRLNYPMLHAPVQDTGWDN